MQGRTASIWRHTMVPLNRKLILPISHYGLSCQWMNRPKGDHGISWNDWFTSVLSNTIATSHLWLLYLNLISTKLEIQFLSHTSHISSGQYPYMAMCVLLSRVRLFVAPGTVAIQAPQSMGFSRQECWVGYFALFQGIFLTQGLNPHLLCLLNWEADSLLLSHLAITYGYWLPFYPEKMWNMSIIAESSTGQQWLRVLMGTKGWWGGYYNSTWRNEVDSQGTLCSACEYCHV